MLALGLNIVVGLAGQLVLGYVAFYAIGAYTYGLLNQYFGLGFWTCLPIGGFLTVLFGLGLGFPVLRLRGDYLAIVTLGFGEIVRLTLQNWNTVTGGPRGVSDIPRPGFFGMSMTTVSPLRISSCLWPPSTIRDKAESGSPCAPVTTSTIWSSGRSGTPLCALKNEGGSLAMPRSRAISILFASDLPLMTTVRPWKKIILRKTAKQTFFQRYFYLVHTE